jgi:MFS family permease
MSRADVVDYRAPDLQSGGGEHVNRLFLACFFSIFATSAAFIVRAMVITEWGTTFNLSEAQKGAIFPGAALFPFAISIVLFSLFIDRLGYGKTMAFAVVAHLVGTVVTILATKATSTNSAYQLLYFGTLITSLANGAVEAVANPVTATLYPRHKTHYLNILHAGWPGGLVAMGVITLLMGSNFSWEWKVALVFIPTLLYGILLLGQRFPVQERVAAGVSYADMMREFGAASAFILAWFLTMATLTVVAVSAPNLAQGNAWDQLNNWGPPIIAIICAVLFFAAYKSFGRPMFIFLLLVMILLATTELGVDGWVTDLMTPAFGKYAGWLLVYTSAIMFVLRFFAGPIVHRISPLGLLAVCAALAAIALFTLSQVGANVALVILAATLYGCGKSFFWPTTLGVVAEQFPRGGALTLSAMGGMGMIAVGVLGGPFLGTLVDKRMDENIAAKAPTIHAIVADGEAHSYGMKYKKIDQSRVAALPPDQQDQFKQIQGQTKQGTLATFAILPTIMLICYIGLIVYFKSRGGYKVQHLEMSGEQASGGLQAPMEA